MHPCRPQNPFLDISTLVRNISIEKNCKCGRRARNLRHLFRSSKRLYPFNNMSVTIIIFRSFFLVKLVTIHFLYLLLIHPILPSCLLLVSSYSSSWSAFLELFKIFNISTNCSWLSSAFLRRISTLYFF
jgi:hypothetical protein